MNKIDYVSIIKDPKFLNIVHFHGYAENKEDALNSLLDLVESDLPLNWFFPDGPIELPFGSKERKRAWQRLSHRKFVSLLEGRSAELSESDFVGERVGSDSIERFFAEICKEGSNLILSGFSQGASLALDFSKNVNLHPRAVLLFSLGFSPILEDLGKRCRLAKFFLSHGGGDIIIPIENYHRICKRFESEGMDFESFEFEGGHEISDEVTQAVSSFIEKILQE